MKLLLHILFLFSILGLLSSCNDTSYASDEDCVDYDYSNCNSIEPSEGFLQIRLTINKQNPAVEVTVYNGDIENNIIITQDTINQPYFYVPVPLNQNYSASAKYIVDDKIIIAIDKEKIRKTSNITCDSTCWEIKGGNIDIRLKYNN